MSKLLKKYGGLILFYVIIVFGVLMLNARYRYLNSQVDVQNTVMESEIALKIEEE